MAKCNKCGAEVLEGALFCTECGEALTSPVEAEVEPLKPEVKPQSNPFSEMEQNVPKPEASSNLVFEDPIQGYKEEQKTENWSNQSNYGKPQFDPNNKPEPVQADSTVNEQPAYGTQEKPAWSAADEKAQNGGAAAGAAAAGAAGAGAAAGAASGGPQAAGAHGGAGGPDDRPWINNQTQNAPYNSGNYYTGPVPEYPNDKIWGVLSYFTIFIWLIAYFMSANSGSRSEFVRTHLNQGLVLNIIGIILSFFNGVGWIIDILIVGLRIWGMVTAARGEAKEMPVIGGIQLIK